MATTYYDLLGVSSDASTETILEAYRERLKETHPDVSDDEDAGERTRKLIEAKEVLTDEAERARYDRLGHQQYVATERAADSGGNGSGKWWTASEDSGDDAGPSTATGRTAGTSDPRDGGAATSASGSASHSDRRARSDPAAGGSGRRRQHDAWRQGGFTDESGSPAGNTWTTDSPYAVRGEEGGLLGSRLFPSSQSLILLAATFLLYPVLLAGALAPPFPLLVNLVLALCLVLTVAYLQSIPEIGIVVFGAWSVLLPAIVVGVLKQPPVSIGTGIALAATLLPLGLSVLTRAVIRY